MSGFTTATNQAVLDDQLGTATRVAPTTPMKLALATVTSTATAAGTEATGYTRPTIAFSPATAANPSVAQNSAALTIPVSTSPTINGVDIFDSAGTPVRKAWGALTAPRTLVAGDSLAFAVGSIQVTLTS